MKIIAKITLRKKVFNVIYDNNISFIKCVNEADKKENKFCLLFSNEKLINKKYDLNNEIIIQSYKEIIKNLNKFVLNFPKNKMGGFKKTSIAVTKNMNVIKLDREKHFFSYKGRELAFTYVRNNTIKLEYRWFYYI